MYLYSNVCTCIAVCLVWNNSYIWFCNHGLAILHAGTCRICWLGWLGRLKSLKLFLLEVVDSLTVTNVSNGITIGLLMLLPREDPNVIKFVSSHVFVVYSRSK